MVTDVDRHSSTDDNVAAGAGGFVVLRKRITEARLLEAQPRYYAFMFALVFGLLLCSLAILLAVRNPWLQMLDAVFLALVSTQLAFLGHDVAHYEVFRSRRLAAIVGLILGNLLMGISLAWWTRNHNAHHSQPNDIDHDPAVDIDILAFTADQARGKRGLARFIVKHQHVLLLPLSSLELINLHRQSLEVVFGRETISHRRAEAWLFGVHVLGYCLIIFLPLGLIHGLLFIAIHKAMTGVIMTSVFAPNHKGMPILETGQSMDFLHRQILTSRNVRGNVLIDFWYGGLNYQIEHHLFPMMPRNRLPAAQPIVKSFCVKQGIAYHETGMLESYREILASFRDVSRALG